MPAPPVVQYAPNGKTRGLITYAVTNFPSHTDLSHEQVYTEIDNAFDHWARVSQFDFTRQENATADTDILIGFRDFTPSTPGAAAECSTRQGSDFKQQIDYVDTFEFTQIQNNSEDTSRFFRVGGNGFQFFHVNGKYDLMTIAMHEIGHALGLDHNPTNDPASIMKDTVLSGLSGSWDRAHPLSACDVDALAALYPNAFPTGLAPSTDGFAIVGSTFQMSDYTSSSPAKDLGPMCWGERAGTPPGDAPLMTAFGWNQNLKTPAPGYGYLYAHLLPADQLNGRAYVVGGGALVQNKIWPGQPATIGYGASLYAGYVPTGRWGSQDGWWQYVARARIFNTDLGHDSEALFYFVLRDSTVPPAILVGYETQIGTQENQKTYAARQWQPQPWNPAGLQKITLAQGRTSAGGKAGYKNANSFVYGWFKPE